ncbi:Protein kinase, membrane associated tyrosine threonine 1 [Mortierella sp. AD094]|nr:Protein kinase, membrane associated tyrosine threonine 1 [Mortierella sp. AD094]
MTQSEDSTKGLTDPFADNLCTPAHGGAMDAMDVDQQEDDLASDTDSTISASLPSSFLSSPGMRTLEQRRVSTPILSTPQTTINPMLLEGEREAAIPRRRVLMSIPHRDDDDDDVLSTPSRVHGSTAPLTRQSFTRSGSLLTKMHEKATLLGKHPQTPSPGEEPRTRSKGLKTLPSKGDDRPPTLPDFSLPETPGLDGGSSLFSPIPPPNFGTPPGTPLKTKPFGLFTSSQHSPIASPFGLGISDDNPFLGTSTRKARFDMDYLSESQWYSDYPHHLTREYLEELFRLDKRVMFSKARSGSGGSPDYLKSNFYVNEIVLGMGEFSDVLKVQSKHNKEFFAVKRLLRTVQGAMERKRYLNEVRNMWRVEKSPHVLELLEAWEQRGKIYMRMELCKLGSNIIHLDIKPDNVFITATGGLKIGDFGLSITYPVEVKDINEGDKYYMAQELLNGQCGKYSDIFSFGMTIYVMVTNQMGELPGEGPQWHYLRDGEIDMTEYTIGKKTPEPSPSIESPAEPSGTVQQPVMALPTDSAISISAMSSKSTPSRRLFSKELIDLVKEMIQPAYEQRPTAGSILKSRVIQQIVAGRTEQGRKGGRSDEAMSGLLLQSI